jgi:O-methyltransferase involved in polyketide biosynthesis
VWGRNGLSHPELATLEGRLLFDALLPAMLVSHAVGGPTLEEFLLARHRLIDDLLSGAIDDGRVTQVIEVACGMSPRGWRFAQRYGDRLTYVEADLPRMAERKRRALERMGSLSRHHIVTEIDALRDAGPQSVAAVASTLDREGGLAIVTEGLLTYFDEGAVDGMLRRFARELTPFSAGLYLADVRLGGSSRSPVEHAFVAVLSTFVRRRVHTHFDGEVDAVASLLEAGFSQARLHEAEAGVHIIEAST